MPSGVSFNLAIVTLLAATLSSRGSLVEDALLYLEKQSAKHQRELLEFASFPSVSAVPRYSKACSEAAEWLKTRLEAAGLEHAELLATDTTHQPVAYADWLHAPGQPTVLIYGHYDVQPAEDVELWSNPPFEPHLSEGYFYGRGIDDDKGGLINAIQAVEAYLKTAGRLPVNVKFLLEGQEEIGSPDLPAFLRGHAAQLAADFSLSADGGQVSEERGILALALRGASAFEVEIKTLDRDVHSGTHGGTVQNANHALARFVAGLHFPNYSVTIPNFYDKVREITPEDKSDMREYGVFDEAEQLRGVGATAAVGEAGFTTLERTWHRPTCDVVGFPPSIPRLTDPVALLGSWKPCDIGQHGGFIGEGVKTIVPGRAVAKVACRLVPDQDPLEILTLAERHVNSQDIPGAQLTFKSLSWAAPPYHMAKDVLANRAAAKVLEDMLGKPPMFMRVGGSIPAAAYMQQYLGITMTMFGFGLPGNNIHAPNERYGLAEFRRAQEGYVRVLQTVAELAASEAGRAGGSLGSDEL